MPSTPLHKLIASKGHNTEMIKHLLRSFDSLLEFINTQDEQGNTALHLAEQHNRTDLFSLLLSSGADPMICNVANQPALSSFLALHKLLLETNFSSLQTKRYMDGCKKPLLSVQINAKNTEGDTPLHLAARSGDESVIKFLVSYGADPTCLNNKGISPFVIIKNRLLKENGDPANPQKELENLLGFFKKHTHDAFKQSLETLLIQEKEFISLQEQQKAHPLYPTSTSSKYTSSAFSKRRPLETHPNYHALSQERPLHNNASKRTSLPAPCSPRIVNDTKKAETLPERPPSISPKGSFLKRQSGFRQGPGVKVNKLGTFVPLA